MKARDWLAKQGLTKKGARGRLSATAKVALEKAISEGMHFTDYQKDETSTSSNLVKVRVQAAPLQNVEKQRDEKVIWAYDKAKYWIAFDTCSGCNRAISYCSHEVPKLPHWVDSEVYWEKAK